MRRLKSSISSLNGDFADCGAVGIEGCDDRTVLLWEGDEAGKFGDGLQGGKVEGSGGFGVLGFVGGCECGGHQAEGRVEGDCGGYDFPVVFQVVGR
jgi:hypothetical protein